ncbi:alpha/beta hydrolase family protein [Streptomyces sp. Je 1-79]|uniref:alpha/beta hydrolase family protein n=1 Tax=Streptomyces sp. Je 1-79 TaxID=2943847 RepID=UPI0021A4475B|nr:alpha/beta hydrolase family protein [Streptomyces sp. Je 1-79]MCT4352872.1 alpha/beta hydrolase family protein [Streptomyces sp. Je 1-79]
MTSFDSSPTLSLWRLLLALAVVFVLLATTGWTTISHPRGPGESRQAALASWTHGRIGHRALPDPSAPARTIAAFFASIGPSQSTFLADAHPLVVGNLDGAPVTLRYRANRLSLARALDAEEDRLETARLSADGRREAVRRAHRFTSLMRSDRQILAFDPTGGGRTAEVLGDLERADRVSVIVPGVDTNLLTFQKTSRKFTAPAGMAESLYAAERRAAPRSRTAVIAWADYTAPVGVGIDAAMGRLATAGAVRLVGMTSALPGDSRVSLFCHSYGSVLCGVAAAGLPSRVTDVVVAGSPGMRVGSAAELSTRARVWAMRDADDWIADVPHLAFGGVGHGADPVEPAFGARLLSAAGADGHTGYFEPGTSSLDNFAAIGVGSYRNLTCASADSACRSGISGAEGV